MPRPKADPERIAQARELIALGASQQEAAQTLGVSQPTIKRWLDEPAPITPAPELPAHMRIAEAPPVEPLDMSDPRKAVEQMIGYVYSTLQRNMVSGDTRQFGSLASTMSKLSTEMRHLTEQANASAEGINVSPGEFAAACADLDAKLAARIERGGKLRCADCERALSVAMGLGTATDA